MYVFMTAARKQKAAACAAGLLLAAALFALPAPKFWGLDAKTDGYFRDAITQAGLAYATVRVINASVSIIKDSTLQLEPAGVGVSLAVGQVLDPIDDMTERLSNVLVAAIASLGVQKLAYEISLAVAPLILGVLLVVLALLVWVRGETVGMLRRGIAALALLVIAGRFCLPLASLANGYLQTHYFDAQIAQAREGLNVSSAPMERLGDLSLPQSDGVLGTLGNSATYLKQRSLEFKEALAEVGANAAQIIENLLTLTFLYVGLFLIQVILLPLLVFWLFVRGTKMLLQGDFASNLF